MVRSSSSAVNGPLSDQIHESAVHAVSAARPPRKARSSLPSGSAGSRIKPAAATKNRPIAAQPQLVGDQPPRLHATRPTVTAQRSAGARSAGRTVALRAQVSPRGRRKRRAASPRPFAHSALLRRRLLELDGGAGLLELRLDRVGLLLVHALLDGVGRPVDEVLGLLEAEAGDRAHDLDHLDL